MERIKCVIAGLVDRLPERVREALGPFDAADAGVWTGAIVFVLALVVAGVLIAFGGHGGAGDSSVTVGQSVEPTGPLDKQGVWNPYVAVVGGGAGATGASEKAWEAVARGFVTDFLGASKDPRWVAEEKPLVSPQLLGRLKYVARGEVPSGKLRSLTMNTSGDHAVDVTASYTSGGAKHTLGVRLVDLPKDGRGWMVYGYSDVD